MEGGPDSVCVLGIDLGTTSVKAALVVGTERGQVVAESCSRETQAYTSSVEAGLQVRARSAAGGSRMAALWWLGCVAGLQGLWWLSWIFFYYYFCACSDRDGCYVFLGILN